MLIVLHCLLSTLALENLCIAAAENSAKSALTEETGNIWPSKIIMQVAEKSLTQLYA